MWYGEKELAERWNEFPCFRQTFFAKTPLSFYQQPLSHLLEADIQAYCKANKQEKERSERFHWIRLNLKWYDDHGKISPSGYYEERRACDNAKCCGTRMLPLDTPQTPKPSLTNIGHYEDSNVAENLLKDTSVEEKLKDLNLFPEIQVDKTRYGQMDYFLPSKALETVYSHRHGLTDVDETKFRKVFPCPHNSLKKDIKKHMEKEKKKGRETQPIPLKHKISSHELYGEKTTRLTETLRNICNCTDPTCQWRVTGVKYDIVSRLMEHADKAKISVGKEIQTMDRSALEKELREVHGLPTSGAILDVKERLARAREKKWLPPQQSHSTKEKSQGNAVLTEDYLFISSIINTITDCS